MIIDTNKISFLTYPKAAAFLEEIGAPLTLNTLRNYVSRGKIPFHKIGSTNRVIFKPEELIRWIEGGTA